VQGKNRPAAIPIAGPNASRSESSGTNSLALQCSVTAVPVPSTAVADTPREKLGILAVILAAIASMAWCVPVLGFPTALLGLALAAASFSVTKSRVALIGLIINSVFLLLSRINAVVGLWLALAIPVAAPTASVARQESQIDPVAIRTKRAWDQMIQVDLRIEALKNDALEASHQLSIQYAQIDLAGVDPDFQRLAADTIRLAADGEEMIQSWRNDQKYIQQSIQSAKAIGAAIGSANERNPSGGAAEGEVLFGLLGSAAAHSQLEYLKKSTTHGATV
jgi:hypothetical protein